MKYEKSFFLNLLQQNFDLNPGLKPHGALNVFSDRHNQVFILFLQISHFNSIENLTKSVALFVGPVTLSMYLQAMKSFLCNFKETKKN